MFNFLKRHRIKRNPPAITISLADYSLRPCVGYKKNDKKGEGSGEDFRETIMKPALAKLEDGEYMLIDLCTTQTLSQYPPTGGYAPVWLIQAFVELINDGTLTIDEFTSKVKFVDGVHCWLPIGMIAYYMAGDDEIPFDANNIGYRSDLCRNKKQKIKQSQ